MAIVLSENFRALFYAPFYAAHATGAFVIGSLLFLEFEDRLTEQL